jgi:hypothetical protein
MIASYFDTSDIDYSRLAARGSGHKFIKIVGEEAE